MRADSLHCWGLIQSPSAPIRGGPTSAANYGTFLLVFSSSDTSCNWLRCTVRQILKLIRLLFEFRETAACLKKILGTHACTHTPQPASHKTQKPPVTCRRPTQNAPSAPVGPSHQEEGQSSLWAFLPRPLSHQGGRGCAQRKCDLSLIYVRSPRFRARAVIHLTRRGVPRVLTPLSDPLSCCSAPAPTTPG